MATEPDRRRYLGSSDIAGILGVSPWTSPYHVWEKKIATDPPEPDPKREAFFRRRTRQEPVIAEMLADELGVAPSRLSWGDPNRYVDPELPYLAAEVDAEFIMCDTLRERVPGIEEIENGETVNVEIKTADPRTEWKWGEPGTDQVPIYYTAQILFAQMVTRRRATIVPVLFGLDRLEIFRVVRNTETESIIPAMRARARYFWTHNVLGRVPPAEMTAAETARLYAKFSGTPIELSNEGADALARVFALREAKLALESELTAAEDALAGHVRAAWGPTTPKSRDEAPDEAPDDAVLTYCGSVVATYKRQRGASLDQKRLAEEYPAIRDALMREHFFRALRKVKGKP